MIDALRQTYAVPELLVELGLARSSYFYHRARLLGPDKYVDVRLAITDVFELNCRFSLSCELCSLSCELKVLLSI